MLAMPMHIIPATTAIPIFMSLAVSVGNFIEPRRRHRLGLLAPLVAGAVVGALLGPQINKRLPNAVLQARDGGDRRRDRGEIPVLLSPGGRAVRRHWRKGSGRGSRARTRDLRFWRPSLYQLSYTPMAGG